MNKRKKKIELPQLTPAELAVMKPLWAAGKMSAREVHDKVGTVQGWTYSTTRTTIDRLVQKKILGKKLYHGLHLYEPRVSRAAGMAALVREFASQVLEVSSVPVNTLFSESDALSDDELAELQDLLNEGERKRR
jgi:predicted transcriptional regulator